jgi:hypothetical protein
MVHGDVSALGLPALLEFVRMQRMSGNLKIRSGPETIKLGLFMGMIRSVASTCPIPPPRRVKTLDRLASDVAGAIDLAMHWPSAQFSLLRDDVMATHPGSIVDPQEAIMCLMQAYDEEQDEELEELMHRLADNDVTETARAIAF